MYMYSVKYYSIVITVVTCSIVCDFCLLDAEGRVVSVDSESLEDGSNKTTKLERPAAKTKTKAGRSNKAGAGEGGGQKRAAQVSLVSDALVLYTYSVFALL